MACKGFVKGSQSGSLGDWLVCVRFVFSKGAIVKSYAELAANIAAVEKMGSWIALSKMFGEMSANQGCVIASHLFITGEPILEYQRRNQLVSGRPNIPYDAMGAAFQERGGDIKVIEKSPNACRLELTYKGKSTPFSLTWEDALKEPFVYNGKEADVVKDLAAGKKPTLKAKYATPRSRATMLYARVISDAIRTVAPEVNFGRYTNEEVDDFDEAHQVDQQSVAGGNLPSPGAAVAPSTASTVAVGSSAVTAPASPAAPNAPSPAQPTAPAPGAATSTTAAPSSVQGGEQPSPLAADPRITIRLDDPATELQKQQIIAVMGQLAQDGMTDIGAKVKAKLATHHIDGILGLTVAEADQLHEALKAKQIEQWTSTALLGRKAKNDGSHPAPS